MEVSVIIISYNTKKLTKECIDSVIKNTKGIKYEIIIVDNASKDGSVKTLQKLKSENSKQKIIIIKNNTNLGFGKANNVGFKKATGDFILFLNSDTLVSDNVIGEMVDLMRNNDNLGITSCALKNMDGSMQGTGGYFPTLIRVFSWMIIQDLPFVDRFIKPFHPMKEKSFTKDEKFYKSEKQLDWITTAYFLIRREVYVDVGGFDEDYFMYTEETDFCFRAKKIGWKVYYLPNWSIIHYGGASGTSFSYVIPEFEGVKLFYKKHYPKWQYPILRLLLKTGAFLRILLFGMLEGKEAAKAYAKAFFKV